MAGRCSGDEPGRCSNGGRAGWIGLILCLTVSAVLPAQDRIDLDAVRAQEEYRWGIQAFHRGLFNEAILALEKALSFRPEVPLTRMWLGRAYYMSGFEDAALSEWRTLTGRNLAAPFLANLAESVAYRRGPAQELSREGRFVAAFELEGDQEQLSLFKRPAGLHARDDGSFFLSAFGSNEVLIVNPNGTVRERFRGGIQGFDHPYDVVGPTREFFFVSEFSANRIAKCAADGTKLLTFGSRGTGAGQLLGPQYLASDDEGGLYVSEWGNRRVSKFDLDGTFMLSFGTRSGSYPGLLGPTGIAVRGGQVFVADRGRNEIAVFDRSGNYLRSLARGMLHGPEGLEVTESGMLLIADADRIVMLDPDSDSIAVVSDLENGGVRVIDAAMDANGGLLVADFDANIVSFLSELSDMYAGLFVRIDRITAERFPEVSVAVTVEDRLGRPVVGLSESGFQVTENHVPVAERRLVFSTHQSRNAAVSLLVERSPEAARFGESADEVTRRLVSGLGTGDTVSVVSAGVSPVVSYEGLSVPDAVAAVRSGGGVSRGWKFDLGLRLAASRLVPDARKKEVVFLSTGTLPQDSFETYGLVELAQYLRNNGIVFSLVDLDGSGADAPELAYLVRTTGGDRYSLSDPKGTVELVDRIRTRRSGTYVLQYRSGSDPDFGRAYIPVEVEVSLVRKSGRDEAGYFAPLEF
jgi:DNA-binding beta-propeller fold protein YncE